MNLEKSQQFAHTWKTTKQSFLSTLLPVISAPSLKLEDISFNTALLFNDVFCIEAISRLYKYLNEAHEQF